MDKIRTLFLVLLLCLLPADHMSEGICGDVDDAHEEPAVKIALTQFDANERTLRLQCEIVNASHHDVWVCESIQTSSFGPVEYGIHMDPDGRTLVVERHLGMPFRIITGRPLNVKGRYTRLAAGERHTVSAMLDLPIEAPILFATNDGGATCATRLVLGIGFFNEDLPGKIDSILRVADELMCTIPSLSQIGAENIGVYMQYFGGLWISKAVGGMAGFAEFWAEGSNQIDIPWEWPINKEESSLKVVLDGVSIPYAGR